MTDSPEPDKLKFLSEPIVTSNHSFIRWHSCPSDTGSYVCGDLGVDTYCPDRQSTFP
ncbi:MAG: hypothetical protein WAM16_03895 [Nitrososphaeraceae archaeon]